MKKCEAHLEMKIALISLKYGASVGKSKKKKRKSLKYWKFIHPFSKYFWEFSYMPGAPLGYKHLVVSKADKFPTSKEFMF